MSLNFDSPLSQLRSTQQQALVPAPNFEKLKGLQERLEQQLIDQPEAVRGVTEMIQQMETGFYDEGKPRGVLVFAGPTGVGKTELAKLTASELGVPLHRFDMSEFSIKENVTRLLGSPLGYQDSEKGGMLVTKLLETPNCVVLFDEIEKAHKDIFKIFLQLFDEGRITNASGKEADAKRAVFILTTNLGSQEIFQLMRNKGTKELDKRLKQIFTQAFSPELYNRFEKIIVFGNLNQSAITKIGEKYLNYLKVNFAKKNLDMIWDKKVVMHLSTLNIDTQLGARDIQRKIRDAILPKLVKSRMEGKISETGAKIRLEMVKGQLTVIVLDKGQAAVVEAKPKESTPSVAKEVSTKAVAEEEEEYSSSLEKAITVENDVVTVDLSQKWKLKQLEGFYVTRTSPNKSGKMFKPEFIKINKVYDALKSAYFDYLERGKVKSYVQLDSSFMDAEWKPITPQKSGRCFLESLCAFVDEGEQPLALQLIERIFVVLKKDVSLSEKPFDSLREHCVKNNNSHLLDEIKILEKIIGPVTVKIISEKPPEQDNKDSTRSRL